LTLSRYQLKVIGSQTVIAYKAAVKLKRQSCQLCSGMPEEEGGVSINGAMTLAPWVICPIDAKDPTHAWTFSLTELVKDVSWDDLFYSLQQRSSFVRVTLCVAFGQMSMGDKVAEPL